ncbi:hypothetical protein fugu_005249 [Takifugu bimaculatus]|uniref:Uncharacterized protein n=1 Tax=Takifugu bimaculatus TaxID=433685 RepID=A0A4Z2BA60_9TELE|nr:hypothetical protein fugu_005249 [Takifugu bimaculatus]
MCTKSRHQIKIKSDPCPLLPDAQRNLVSRWSLVMRATQKQLHRHHQNKKHKKDLHKELSQTLKGPRIHLQRKFCPKDRPEEVRRAQRCLEPAPLRTTSPSPAGQPRRGEGRGRRDPTRTEGDSMEEPDKMRTIDEEIPDALDISVEQLRTSDTETNPASADNIDVDFEVLRRDICCDLDRDDLSELRPRDPLREGPQTRPSHPDSRPGGTSLRCSRHDNLTLEDVQSLLRSAWLSFVHVPSPSIYTTLSSLLALSTGQQDPVTTAMLHAHSIGITSRHRTIRHLTSCLK